MASPRTGSGFASQSMAAANPPLVHSASDRGLSSPSPVCGGGAGVGVIALAPHPDPPPQTGEGERNRRWSVGVASWHGDVITRAPKGDSPSRRRAMRWARWVVVGALLCGLTTRAADQKPVLYPAVVTAPEAEVRSGAGNSPQLYPTNRLRKGEQVEVVQEMPGGWLAIKPPPGSFSWINTRFVQELLPGRGLWVVNTHPDVRVPVRVGSELRTDPPTIEGARLARGTQL